jgi:hypothetical protein
VAYEIVAVLTGSKAERRVAVVRTPAGLFVYSDQRYFHPIEIDGAPIEGSWDPVGASSGYYQTAEEASAAARAELAWLRDSNRDTPE